MNNIIETSGLTLALPDAASRDWLGRWRRKVVLKAIDFAVGKGETVGIVGESGSGKTSLARCLVQLIKPTSGQLIFDGADIIKSGPNSSAGLRKRVQMIFQDPASSLNPRHKVHAILADPLIHYGLLSDGTSLGDAIDKILFQVGLDADLKDRYPHELSGGQRQRVAIARAIAVEPDFVVADEIVSGLDVSTQVQVLQMLSELKQRLGLSMAFISHDLSVVRQICDRVYVMREGEVVEVADCVQLFANPQTDYVRTLIDAIPLPEPDLHWLDEDVDREPQNLQSTEKPSQFAEIAALPENLKKENSTMMIKGAVVLVTGANRGVGKCFVDELALRGAEKIYVTARDKSSLVLPEQIGATKIISLMLDVTDQSQIEAVSLVANDTNLLINNAGVNTMQTLMGAEDIDGAKAEMDTNYFGTVAMSRAFGPLIQANGGGMIINMLSVLALANLPVMGSLSASKAAAYSATGAIRAEFASDGVEVLAVLPGAIDTDMSRDFDGPKMSPLDVVAEILDAAEAGQTEVYPGEMAKQIRDQLREDPAVVHAQMAASLEEMKKKQGSVEEFMTITASDGESFEAYVARPESGSGPGLVLLQEIFGINSYMKSMAQAFAEEGYLVVVPDLFWRLETGVNLGYEDEDLKRAFELYGQFDVDMAVNDIQDTITAVRQIEGFAGKVGATGYCLGGLLAYLTAARTDVDVSVGYYAVGIEKHLDEVEKIACPLTLHIAGDDLLCPPEAQTAIGEALRDRENVKIYTYDGKDHAFATPARDSFDKPATMMAYSRTLAALRGVLGPVYDLESLWDMHCYYEFATRDVDSTMATMVGEPYVNHIPTMTGGVGHDQLKRFYKYHFVDANPEDTALIPISRTVGSDRLVDEMLFCFTHTREIDWMLPGIEPTGKYVEIPLVAIVNFRGDKLYHEHIYWDQASVLVQIGKLDPDRLPTAGGETAKKLLDEGLPSNELMRTAWATSEDRPI